MGQTPSTNDTDTQPPPTVERGTNNICRNTGLPAMVSQRRSAIAGNFVGVWHGPIGSEYADECTHRPPALFHFPTYK
jgi:hypothetical protein